MEITYASQAAPGAAVNDDLVIAGQSWVVVLDGATASGRPTGCIHTVRWYVEQLGTALAVQLLQPGPQLGALLATAIETVNRAHASTCDLTHPSSPSSTVAILREQNGSMDYLVLADSPLVLRLRTGEVRPVIDDRTDHLPSYAPEDVERLRNTAAGFWVASTKPEAAEHAVSGSISTSEVTDVALMTDGVSRLVTGFGMSWEDVLRALSSYGPQHVIDQVRTQEETTPVAWRGGKAHDDATVAFVRV